MNENLYRFIREEKVTVPLRVGTASTLSSLDSVLTAYYLPVMRDWLNSPSIRDIAYDTTRWTANDTG